MQIFSSRVVFGGWGRSPPDRYFWQVQVVFPIQVKVFWPGKHYSRFWKLTMNSLLLFVVSFALAFSLVAAQATNNQGACLFPFCNRFNMLRISWLFNIMNLQIPNINLQHIQGKCFIYQGILRLVRRTLGIFTNSF